MAETDALPAMHVPALARARSAEGRVRIPLIRFALALTAFVYLALVLLGPLGALLVETAKIGFLSALSKALAPTALLALKNSAWLVLITLVVNSVVGALGGVVLVRHRFPGRALVSALCDLPLAVSPVMIGLSFLLLVGKGGLLGPLLEALDLKIVFSFWGLVLGTLFVTLPYSIREVSYVLEELGTDEEEASTTLGASPWQTFFKVTLPNIRVALGYGVLMAMARSLGEFGAVLVLGGSISGQTQTATTFIHDAMEERNLEAAYGMSLLLALFSSGLLFVLERLKKKQAKSQSKIRL